MGKYKKVIENHYKTTEKPQAKSQNCPRAFEKIKISNTEKTSRTINQPAKNLKTCKIETVQTGKTLKNAKNTNQTSAKNQKTPSPKKSHLTASESLKTPQHPKQERAKTLHPKNSTP